MIGCQQTPNQNILEHGIAVKNATIDIIDILNSKENSNYKIPDFIFKYKDNILKSLLPREIIEEYTTYHDCGKPYCVSEDGKHFINHAEVSYNKWLEVGGNPQVANLIRKDMMIHTMSADDIDEFIKYPEAITLLIVGLAEIHANAEMFGGIDSTSFKIKYKQISKRGKKICDKLYGEQNVDK